MIRFTEHDVKTKTGRLNGYVEAVLAIAVRNGDALTITDEQAAEIRERFTDESKKATQKIKVARAKCLHLGSATDMTVPCPTCSGTVNLKLFTCGVHGVCTPGKQVNGKASCVSCKEYSTIGELT